MSRPAGGQGTRLPVVDLARRNAALWPEIAPAIERVVRSGRLLLGPETEAFEAELAEFCGRRFAVAVASGTDALRLSLLALDIGPGDEVIVPAFTAVPTAAAVCAVGATPVPVEVDAETAAVDASAAGAARTERTKAVIPVHLYGRPAAIPEIGVPVIEDGAQALGALDAATRSASAAYSFYPTKNLGGIGDGGAVVTDDAAVADRVRLLRRHGDEGDYRHVAIAGNSRLSEVEAAALRIGLRHLPAQNRRRREVAAASRAANPARRWQAPHPRHVYHLCVLREPDREAFRARVPFQTAVHYPHTLGDQPAYRQFRRAACPAAESWAAECISVPCFAEMTDDEIEGVCRALR